MNYFINQVSSQAPQQLNMRDIFLSTFQAATILFSSPKKFLMCIAISLLVVISFFIPIAAIIAIPGALIAYLAILVSYIRKEKYSGFQLLSYVNHRYPKRIAISAALLLIPYLLIFAIAAYVNSYLPLPENTRIPNSAIWSIFGSAIFILVWGLVFAHANVVALAEKSTIVTCIVEAVEHTFKNVIALFILSVNWLMGLAFFFFIAQILVIVVSQYFNSYGPQISMLASLGCFLLVLSVANTFFMMNLVVIAYQKYAPNIMEDSAS